MSPEQLHGKWGIWLYDVDMWYHVTIENIIRPRVYETEKFANAMADKLWQEHKCKAQVRQYDMSRSDFPKIEEEQ